MGNQLQFCCEAREEAKIEKQQSKEIKQFNRINSRANMTDEQKQNFQRKKQHQQCKRKITLFHDQIVKYKSKPFEEIYERKEIINTNSEVFPQHFIQYIKIFNKLTEEVFMLHELQIGYNNTLFMQKLSLLNHPNILHIYEYFENKQINLVIYEQALYGSLQDQINNQQKNEQQNYFDESVVICVAKQLLQVLVYAHDNNYMCQNIFPSNILLSKENTLTSGLKVGGFNFSARIPDIYKDQDIQKFEFIDTVVPPDQYYFPPEIKESSHKNSTPKIDIFALSIILFQMLLGMHPDKVSKTQDLIIRKSLSTVQSKIQPAFYDLLVKMSKSDPLARYSAKEALNSSIFTQTPLIPQICDNFVKQVQKFKRYGSLKQFLTCFLMHQYTRQDQKEELYEVFLKFDQDMDGYLGEKDLLNIYQNSSKQKSEEYYKKQIKKIFTEYSLQKKVDANQQSKLELYEFLTIYINMEKNQQQKAGELCFFNLDYGQKEVWDKNDFQKAFQNSKNSDKDIKFFFDLQDIDQSGIIEIEEFQEVFEYELP